jgi:hypothetical protein
MVRRSALAALAACVGCGGSVSPSSPTSDAGVPPGACSTSAEGTYDLAMTSVGGGGFPSLHCSTASGVVLQVAGDGSVTVQGPPALPSTSGASDFVPWSACTASSQVGDAGVVGKDCPQVVTVTCAPDAGGGFEVRFVVTLDASGQLVPCTDPTFTNGEQESCSGSYAQYASYCTAQQQQSGCCVDSIVCNWTLGGERSGP